MTNKYPYEKRSWYPHMMPEDVAVWNRYIDANPDAYKTCLYDFVVGTVPDFVKADPAADQASMERLYKKKIDAIGLNDGVLDIIELKPICNMSTIGQVKGYLHLYVRDEKPATKPQAVVICGAASADVLEFAENENVRVVVV